MLSGVAVAVIVLYGGYQAIERQHHGRHGRGVRRGAVEPVRPDPAALPALRDLPVGHGGAREDLPAARRAPRPRGPPRRDRARPHPRRGRFEDVSFAYARRRRARRDEAERGVRCSRSTDVSLRVSRPGRPSRWSAPPAPASRRWRSSSRASTTPRRGACWSTATTCARSSSASLRSQMGIVPQEAFLFSGTIAREHRLRAPRRRRERRSAPPRGRRRRGVHRRARPRLRHRGGRARRAALSRPAPADRLRARADRRPAHPGARRGDLQRRPAHRGAHRGGPAHGCSRAAPRS